MHYNVRWYSGVADVAPDMRHFRVKSLIISCSPRKRHRQIKSILLVFAHLLPTLLLGLSDRWGSKHSTEKVLPPEQGLHCQKGCDAPGTVRKARLWTYQVESMMKSSSHNNARSRGWWAMSARAEKCMKPLFQDCSAVPGTTQSKLKWFICLLNGLQ